MRTVSERGNYMFRFKFARKMQRIEENVKVKSTILASDQESKLTISANKNPDQNNENTKDLKSTYFILTRI